MTDLERKLAKLEQMMRNGLVAVLLNGRKASEFIALHGAVEALSCSVQTMHRARAQGNLPKKLQKRIERAHALVVKVTIDAAGELSDAITRKP